jgi:hypothetical protein
MSDKKEISRAFRQIRDQVMQGKLPFVFWEDIDSENFRWLRYLLSPMKDGFIQEKNKIRHIGQCIFIFTGSSEHGKFFYKQEDSDPGREPKKTGKRKRKRLKVSFQSQ